MPYFVTIKHTRGIAYLYVMHSTYVRGADGLKHKKQRVIRSFGRVEPLLKKDPMFVEKLKQMYPNQRQLRKIKLEQEAVLKEQQAKASKTQKSSKATKASKEATEQTNKK